MAYAHLATQERNLSIIEYLGDQAHTPMGANGLAVVHRYACCLLSAVLQGIKGIIDGLGHIIARLIKGDSDNAAGIVQTCASGNNRQQQ